jgi:hypothetical protein
MTPEEQELTGRVFHNCTFNAAVTFNGNVFIDSYGYRNIGDVLRLQEQRLQQLQQQSSISDVAVAPTTLPASTQVTSATSDNGQVSQPSAPSSGQRTETLPTSSVASRETKAVKPRKTKAKTKTESEEQYQLVDKVQDD